MGEQSFQNIRLCYAKNSRGSTWASLATDLETLFDDHVSGGVYPKSLNTILKGKRKAQKGSATAPQPPFLRRRLVELIHIQQPDKVSLVASITSPSVTYLNTNGMGNPPKGYHHQVHDPANHHDQEQVGQTSAF